jgi:hypothetical protein
MLARRNILAPPRIEESPPPLLRASGKKQALECSTLPAAAPPNRPAPEVPSLNLSKVSNLHAEASLVPAVSVLTSHRALPPSAFIAMSSERTNVRFFMPKGMSKHFRSRHVELLVPSPPKHHPIFTSRQMRQGEK